MKPWRELNRRLESAREMYKGLMLCKDGFFPGVIYRY
jgi:hypothetical protein